MTNDEPGLGHNAVDADQLFKLVQRIESKTEDRDEISDEIKEIYATAKSLGYDTKIVRKLIALRKIDPDERSEANELMRVYARALGDPDPFS